MRLLNEYLWGLAFLIVAIITYFVFLVVNSVGIVFTSSSLLVNLYVEIGAVIIGAIVFGSVVFGLLNYVRNHVKLSDAIETARDLTTVSPCNVPVTYSCYSSRKKKK